MKDVFHDAFRTRTERNDDLQANDTSKHTAAEILGYALNDTVKPFFENWKSSVCAENNYLCTCLYIGNQNPKNVIEQVKNINEGLKHYPTQDNHYPPRVMPEDDIINCINNAKKLNWHITMMAQGKCPDSFKMLADAQEYYEQLYRANAMQKEMEKPSKNVGTKSKKRKNAGDKLSEKKKCRICGRTNHTTEQHKSKEELQQQFKHHKSSNKYHKKESSETKMWNTIMAQVMEQMFTAGANSVKKSKKKHKAKEATNSFMASLQEKMKKPALRKRNSRMNPQSKVARFPVMMEAKAIAIAKRNEK